ncbi:unnamed protein product [Caenorhabditis sp. 36 PRJEB53466]|nr:unnamed protein product [Caenorhabditis sp. 36 PRJEB53466]
MSRILILILSIGGTFADYTKLKLGGECDTLRNELEGSDNATVKLSKLNTFLDSLGSDTRQKFWAIIAAAKTDAQTNLPSDSAKTLAAGVISDFEEGNLFLPAKQVSSDLKSKFESLSDADKAAVKNLAKVYGKQIKVLVMPLLPENCKVTSEAASVAANATQSGGFDTAEYMPRRKRELLFIENLTAAFREYRRRRNV